MKSHPLRTLSTVVIASVGMVANASNFQIDIQPLFQGTHRSPGTQPVAVELENGGPDARGVLRISTNDFSMSYPVELPHDGKKRIVTYPSFNFSQMTATLETDHGSESKVFPGPTDYQDNVSNVLLIGDTPGALGFLTNYRSAAQAAPETSAARAQARQINDIYCTPADAPPRPIAYASVKAIFLGAGAERISDASVAAIKTWMLEGGTLVFVGGASSPTLTDPRWQTTLPATNFEPKTVSGSDTLASLGQEELNNPITLLEPQDVKGASIRGDGKTIITAEAGYGMGKVIYLAFNPLEAPLNHWAGRSAAVSSILRPSLLATPQTFLSQFSHDLLGGNSTMPPPPSTGGPGTMITSLPISSTAGSDPFSTTLPPAEKVFIVLAGYFIAVVPINFLVLKKLKRAELAWFTAPVLSLGFASILFQSAGNLYSKKMSTASQGIILVRQDLPNAVFVGTTQMFIPHGGHYDLGMKGIDSLGVIDDNPYGDRYGTETNDNFDLDPVDDGEVTVPNMLASNLAFKEISYRQELPGQNKYSIRMHREGKDAVCEVQNLSKSPLKSVIVYVGKRSKQVGTIEAGKTDTVRIDLTAPLSPKKDPDLLEMSFASNGGAAFGALVSDFRPGPQIGENVESRSQVTLLVFSKDALGGTR
jgi:hypothetical protein